MSNYQDNINDIWEMAPQNFSITSKVFPYVFHYDYEKYRLFENSNKIVASKILLYQVSKYDNLIFPIHIQIDRDYIKNGNQDDSTIFTIMEFCEDTDAIYIPNNFYQNIDLDKLIESDNKVKFNIVNNQLEKATNITLKPFKSSFYQIPNPKQYLEIHLKRNYTVLKQNQIISLIFKDTFLDFDITSLTGDGTDADADADTDAEETYFSIIDTDLTVEFEKSYDYVEPASFPKAQIKKKENDDESDVNKRFPGKGNRLGD